MVRNLRNMVKTKKLLVDADAFVALHDKNDPNFKLALKISQSIVNQKIPLITSDPAFGEAITVMSQNTSLKLAIEFAEDILASPIEIVEVDSGLRREALEIFKKQKSKNTRFTDCVNIAILENVGLKEIFSFDADYKKNGILRIGVDTSADFLKVD